MEILRFILLLCCSVLVRKSVLSEVVATAVEEFHVKEELRPGDVIGTIDPNKFFDDVGKFPSDNVSFQVLHDSSIQLIKVESRSGKMRANSLIDRDALCPFEEECQLNFDVEIRVRSKSSIVSVKVNIEDINDNAPKFPKSSYRLEISESSPTGKSYHLPRATDPDSATYSISHYAMKSGSQASDYFKIDLKTVRQRHNGRKSELQPVLTQIRNLDRENISSFSFVLQAFDSEQKVGEKRVVIDILDSNDNSPKWIGTPYRKNITECFNTNQEIFTLHAEDEDAGENGVVHYRISDRAMDLVKQKFYINSNKLYLSGKLDYDDKKTRRIDIPILAVDGGNLQAETTVDLELIDCNDNKPIISIRYMGQDSPRIAHLEENHLESTRLAIIQVSDKDSGKSGDVNCKLNNNDFKLEVVPRNNANNKIYYFIKKEHVTFDRERNSRVTVTITCFDNGPTMHETQERLHIQIGDLNDNAPVFYGESEFRFEENRAPNVEIGYIKAKDIDAGINQNIDFTILPTKMQDYFTITKSGQLYSRRSFDREVQDGYTFTVRATDNGSPPQSAEKNITVHITDVNDCAPTYIGERDFYVYESRDVSSVRYFLGILNASDADINHNSRVVFEIDRRTDATYKHSYHIESNNALWANGVLDREISPINLITVIVKDRGSPALSTTVTLTIHLLDVNDNAPHFFFPSKGNNRINITHSTTAGTTIATIVAKDADYQENGTVTYSLSNSVSKYFTLQENGLLILAQSFEAFPHTTKRYTLHIIARDGGLKHRMSNSTQLYVYILPAYQGPPRSQKGGPLGGKQPGKFDSDDTKGYSQENNMTILLCLAAAVIIVFLVVLGAFAYIYIKGDPFCSEILGSRNDRYSSDEENAESAKHLRHPPLRDDSNDRAGGLSEGQNTSKLLKHNTLDNSRYVTAHDRLGMFCRTDPRYATKSKPSQFISTDSGLDSYYRELLPINNLEESKDIDIDGGTFYSKGNKKERCNADVKNKTLLYEVGSDSDSPGQFKSIVDPCTLALECHMPDYQVYAKSDVNQSRNAYNELTKFTHDEMLGNKAPVNIHFYETYSKNKSQSATSTPVLTRPPKITSSFV